MKMNKNTGKNALGRQPCTPAAAAGNTEKANGAKAWRAAQGLLCRRAAIPALCYLLAVIGWLGWKTISCAADAAARVGGTLVEQQLAVSNFHLVDLAQMPAGEEQGAAVVAETGEPVVLLQSTSGDPQMILEDVRGESVAGTMVRTLQIWCSYDTDPREMCLYYTTRLGEDYSQDRRVFPARQADGSYLYTLPRTTLVSLRLDPCSPDEGKTVTLTVEKILLNQPTPAWRSFVPSWYALFCLILYPALAAAALSLAGQWWHWFAEKKASVQKAEDKKT